MSRGVVPVGTEGAIAMSYRCGTRGLSHLGIADGDARIICDVCGATLSAETRVGGPQRWLLDGKAPKGWQCKRDSETHTRYDVCPQCCAAEKGV